MDFRTYATRIGLSIFLLLCAGLYPRPGVSKIGWTFYKISENNVLHETEDARLGNAYRERYSGLTVTLDGKILNVPGYCSTEVVKHKRKPVEYLDIAIIGRFICRAFFRRAYSFAAGNKGSYRALA